MRNENYTTITEFTVTKPRNNMETVGEKIKLSFFGEYCPDASLRGYSLLQLLDHPDCYRPSKLIMRGKTFIIPEDRKGNESLTVNLG